MTMRPCLDCGDLTTAGTRCTVCRPPDHQLSATRRGYDAAWQRLSRQARRLQPWCSDCGAEDDLTTDHSREAWEAKSNGRAITLAMVTVVCRSCNSKRGRARPSDHDDDTTPGDPPSKAQRPLGKAEFESEIASVGRGQLGVVSDPCRDEGAGRVNGHGVGSVSPGLLHQQVPVVVQGDDVSFAVDLLDSRLTAAETLHDHSYSHARSLP